MFSVRTVLHGMAVLSILLPSFVLTNPSLAVVTETLKLLPNDGVAGDDFGNAVAVNGSGLALVGAPKSGPGGAAYVFNALTGEQLFKLVPDDQTTNSRFGISLAVQGNLALIGAPGQDSTGAAYLFDMTTGVQVDKLIADDAATAPSGFGNEVAMHNQTAVIGASAAAYLFDLGGGTQIAKLTNPSADDFGESVDIHNGIAIVSSYDAGLLFDSATGASLASLPLPYLTYAGKHVAISGDKALIGHPANTYASFGTGHLYDISDLNNTALITTVYSDQPGVDTFFFGSSVELQDDIMLVGTWFASDGGPAASGAIYQFDPLTGDLIEVFRSSDPAYDDQFGISMDLSGTSLIVGARGFENTDFGSAYLFTIPEPSAATLLTGLGIALLGRARRV